MLVEWGLCLDENAKLGGHINYVLSRLLWQSCGHVVAGKKEPLTNAQRRYERMNTVIGAMEAAKLEFYRRMVVPYEDEKIEESGDI